MRSINVGISSLKPGLTAVYDGSKQAQIRKAQENGEKLKKVSIKLAGPVSKPF